MSIERRVHARAPVHLRIAYASAGVLKTDYSENISRGGLFVATEDHFELGQRVALELFCAGTRVSVPVEATVRWCGAQSPGPDQPPILGIGLEFDTLTDPVKRSHFEALIDAAFEPAPAVDPRNQLRILIVDPNRYARELFRNGLTAMAREVFEVDGYLEVLEAADGLEALELARGVRFDLYMVELRTPEVDGGEIIRRIRRQVTQQTPIFALSRPYPGDKAEAIAAGADVFLRKPVQLKPLFNTLKVLLKFDERRTGATP
jgi:uncharacterized protein (TIGR02266 family)